MANNKNRQIPEEFRLVDHRRILKLKNLRRSQHRCEAALSFLGKCVTHHLTPKCVKDSLGEKDIKRNQMTKSEIRKFVERKLNAKIEEQKTRLADILPKISEKEAEI